MSYPLLFSDIDPRDWLVCCSLLSFLCSLVFYILYKFVRGEKMESRPKIFLTVGMLLLISSFWYFVMRPETKSVHAWASRELDHDCLLFGAVDSYHIWHVLLTAGAFCVAMGLLYMDDDLERSNDMGSSGAKIGNYGTKATGLSKLRSETTVDYDHACNDIDS